MTVEHEINQELGLDQLRLQFLANMNHELRTPLNGLMGATELLAMTELSPEQSHYLKIFRHSSEQLLGLIENILDFSKMVSGELRLSHTHLDLRQLLCDCYVHFLPFAEKKGLELRLDLSTDFPRWIYSDAKRLMQVFNHLVCNALKFTEEGCVVITGACDQDTIELRIRDTGMGISDEQQERIFEAFYQEDSSHTRKHGGVGIGLAISHFLTQALGGELSMSSEPNKGSEFLVRFPFLVEPEADLATNVDRGRQPRILLVEDNEINQAIVFLLFSKRGLHIDIAQDGLEGLNIHRKNPYDLIVMDMQMPVMDGIEATREIRKFDPDVQIIALTANLQPEDKKRGIEAGMNDFLAKPLNPATIEKLIDQASNHSTH